MPKSRFLILALAMALLALVTIPGVAVAEMSEAEIIAYMTRALDEMRAHPGMKDTILGRIRSKAQANGAQDLDARMAGLGAKLDQAAALSDADYAAQKQALASKMADIITGEAAP